MLKYEEPRGRASLAHTQAKMSERVLRLTKFLRLQLSELRYDNLNEVETLFLHFR